MRRVGSHFYPLLVTTVVATGTCATSTVTIDRAETLGVQFVDQLGISGLAIAVGKDDEIVWSHGYGFADLEHRIPVSPTATRFRVGSVSKPMTAVAVVQLYQDGRLDIDAPVQDYVPYFPEKEGVVTTRLLAGHLAGIRNYADGEYYNTRAYDSVEQAISVFAGDPLEFAPGTAHRYTSYGYNLISAVIEGASGQPFLDYMREHVFAPAGMSRTIADHVDLLIPDRARPYEIQDGVLVNAPWVDNSVKWAGGGFLSTADDLVRFGLAHFSAFQMNQDALNLLWESQKTIGGEVVDYGIGWRLRTDSRGRRVVYHGGSAVGGTTDLHVYPDDGLVIAAISNTSPAHIPLAASQALVDELADLFLRQ
ncbi:MAG: serine hydrolase domain-containing protein [Pseudomonadota bacterium]